MSPGTRAGTPGHSKAKGPFQVATDDTDNNAPKRQKAVALKGDGTLESAPVVTAVGFGKNAEQILDLAFTNDVKVRQDADLAEILAAMEVESPVPLEALEAVSEILSYVYGLNSRMGTSESTPHSDQT